MITAAQNTPTSTMSNSLRALTASTCMLLAAPFAQADDGQYFTEVAPGVVKDSRTGLEWMRCSLGQEWSVSANTCKGEASFYTWERTNDLLKKLEAMGGYALRNGWRVPTSRELVEIRYCSKGDSKLGWSVNPDGKGHIGLLCRKGSAMPSINQAIFPGTSRDWYWEAFLDENNILKGYAGVNFGNGNYRCLGSGSCGRYGGNAVRLVRSP